MFGLALSRVLIPKNLIFNGGNYIKNSTFIQPNFNFNLYKNTSFRPYSTEVEKHEDENPKLTFSIPFVQHANAVSKEWADYQALVASNYEKGVNEIEEITIESKQDRDLFRYYRRIHFSKPSPLAEELEVYIQHQEDFDNHYGKYLQRENARNDRIQKVIDKMRELPQLPPHMQESS